MAMPKGAIVAAGRDRTTGGRFAPDDMLTDRQAAFIKHYLANGGDVQEAALNAGYANGLEGYRLVQRPSIAQAIAKQLLPRTARMAHGVTDLLEAQLAAWARLVELNPDAALSLPTKELRGLLSLALSQLLPPPKADNDPSVIKGDRSVEELEAELTRARLARSDAARMIEGDAEPIPSLSVPDPEA